MRGNFNSIQFQEERVEPMRWNGVKSVNGKCVHKFCMKPSRFSIHSTHIPRDINNFHFTSLHFNFKINNMQFADLPTLGAQPLSFDCSDRDAINKSFKRIKKIEAEKGADYATYAVEVLARALEDSMDNRNEAQDDLPGNQIVKDWKICVQPRIGAYAGTQEEVLQDIYSEMIDSWVRFEHPAYPGTWFGMFYGRCQAAMWMDILREYRPNMSDSHTPSPK